MERARLTRHRFEVALSRGRQAVERARLAGAAWLIGESSGDDPRALAAALASGACGYALLRRHGQAAHAALVGATVAAAQLGLYWSPRGTGAGLAARLAVCLHPGVRDWRRPLPPWVATAPDTTQSMARRLP